MIRSMKRVLSAGGAAVAVALGAGAVAPSAMAAPSAHASVPTTYCQGKSQVSVVKTYARGGGRYALRCGTSSWGFNHITHRWNSAFDSKMALTFAYGEDVNDVQQDGGSVIFALFDNRCHQLFRIIYNGGALHGNGVRPQGVITAYDTSGPVSAGPMGAGPLTAAGPAYRTDCPVYQGI